MSRVTFTRPPAFAADPPGVTFRSAEPGIAGTCLNCGRPWGGHAANRCYELDFASSDGTVPVPDWAVMDWSADA